MRLTEHDLALLGYAVDGRRLEDCDSDPVESKSAQREADLHDAILAYCRKRGWPVVHSRMDRPATCGVGTPDFVVALPGGRTVWIEAKAAKGKLRPEQSAWLAALRGVGHIAEVVRSMEDFVSVIPMEVRNG